MIATVNKKFPLWDLKTFRMLLFPALLNHGFLTLFNAPYLWTLSPLELTPHCSSIHKPPPQELPVHELWKGQNWLAADKCIDYIYNKYFVSKLTTLFLHQKCFIKNNIVNKIKCTCIDSITKYYLAHNEKQLNVNFDLNLINSWCINCNHYIQNKIKNKLCMKAISCACFRLEKKPLLEIHCHKY